ncbi:hypothetical protein BW425_16300 [Bacillus pseudomycoides]|uniref:Uncharacterized protein n=1 Tax=Bacillus pseudomycoides TaxID=64104 RepID=A0A1Y3MCV8_9BACI|nr:hypothetical protein BW425_16300 [Bacillus pseudomycoides]
MLENSELCIEMIDSYYTADHMNNESLMPSLKAGARPCMIRLRILVQQNTEELGNKVFQN